MKNAFKTIMALALATIMLAISPMTDLSCGFGESGEPQTAKAATVAKAAEENKNGGKTYLSDVKIGNCLCRW